MSRDDYKARHPQAPTLGALLNPTPTPADTWPRTTPASTGETVQATVKELAQAAITERFIAFHQANPQVYEALRRMAFDAKLAGRSRASIKMMWEAIRWDRYIAGKHTDSEWRLDNSYTSRYARLLMLDNPELEGLFELRELHTS